MIRFSKPEQRPISEFSILFSPHNRNQLIDSFTTFKL